MIKCALLESDRAYGDVAVISKLLSPQFQGAADENSYGWQTDVGALISLSVEFPEKVKTNPNPSWLRNVAPERARRP